MHFLASRATHDSVPAYVAEKKRKKRGGNQEMHVIKRYRDTSVVSTACTRPTVLLSFHRLSFQCLLSRGRHAYSKHAILPKSLDSTQPVHYATRVAIICAISVPGKCRGQSETFKWTEGCRYQAHARRIEERLSERGGRAIMKRIPWKILDEKRKSSFV